MTGITLKSPGELFSALGDDIGAIIEEGEQLPKTVVRQKSEFVSPAEHNEQQPSDPTRLVQPETVNLVIDGDARNAGVIGGRDLNGVIAGEMGRLQQDVQAEASADHADAVLRGLSATIAAQRRVAESGDGALSVDEEMSRRAQVDAGAIYSARKVCAGTKIVGSLVTAAMVYPGEDGGSLSNETVERLMGDAVTLAHTLAPLVGLDPSDKFFKGNFNLLLQQSADFVGTMHRMQHAGQSKVVTTSDLVEAYSKVLDAMERTNGVFEHADERVPYPNLSRETGRRMALVEVTQNVMRSVGRFNYFHDRPMESIAGRAMERISANAELATKRLMGAEYGVNEAADRMVEQAMIGHAGRTFCLVYEQEARKDVKRLSAMDKATRDAEVLPYLVKDAAGRVRGLPIDHVMQAFDASWARTVDLVVDLAAAKAIEAPAQEKPAQETVAIGRETAASVASPVSVSPSAQVAQQVDAPSSGTPVQQPWTGFKGFKPSSSVNGDESITPYD